MGCTNTMYLVEFGERPARRGVAGCVVAQTAAAVWLPADAGATSRGQRRVSPSTSPSCLDGGRRTKEKDIAAKPSVSGFAAKEEEGAE